MGLKRLVDQATDRLVRSGLANTEGLRATHTATGYVRYLWLAGAGAKWGIDYEKWGRLRDTPLWLELRGQEDAGWKSVKPLREIVQSLDSYRRSDPQGLFELGGIPVMPFDLPVGVEEDAVLDTIVQRLERIARLIGSA